jgi:hypothetical protein
MDAGGFCQRLGTPHPTTFPTNRKGSPATQYHCAGLRLGTLADRCETWCRRLTPSPDRLDITANLSETSPLLTLRVRMRQVSDGFQEILRNGISFSSKYFRAASICS